jgi:hypothetical protein
VSTQLESLLPGPRPTLFLRACLLERDEAKTAWREWLAGTDDPVSAFADPRQACRRLAPLLTGVATGPGSGRLGGAVKASAVREELRWRVLASAAAETVGALTAVGLEPVLSGGAAAALTVYANPWHRHCHDVDLVLGPLRPRAADTVTQAGLRPVQPGRLYQHPSGTVIALHATGLRSSAHPLSVDDLRGRAHVVPLGAVQATVASREHILLGACEGAFAHARSGALTWAADAAMIARSLDARGWSRVVEAAEASRTATPGVACLRYLCDRVGVPVPGDPMSALEALAAREGPGAEQACLALVPRTSTARRLARRARGRLSRLAAAVPR